MYPEGTRGRLRRRRLGVRRHNHLSLRVQDGLDDGERHGRRRDDDFLAPHSQRARARVDVQSLARDVSSEQVRADATTVVGVGGYGVVVRDGAVGFVRGEIRKGAGVRTVACGRGYLLRVFPQHLVEHASDLDACGGGAQRAKRRRRVSKQKPVGVHRGAFCERDGFGAGLRDGDDFRRPSQHQSLEIGATREVHDPDLPRARGRRS
mmetsp:Transcript_3135/g.12571  ORF Transcript_3135/g.12571 Transcript_3135/m.12571 type:complete len:207 (-) Transcript_3135:3718-4338(-)